MRNLLFICALFLILLLNAGCEEIPPEIPPIQSPTGTKNLIIEEFSGVQCPNCPAGDAQIGNLQSLYGDRVVAVTMHPYVTGVLSAPMSDSRYDFRTDAAEAIIDNLGLPSGIPAAAINRIQFEGESGLLYETSKWAGMVEKELARQSKLGLSLEVSYEPETRELEVRVEVIGREDISFPLRIHLGLMEDGMIDKQIDGQSKIDFYEHNHILRDYITDYLGDDMVSSLSTDENWSRTYSYTLPEEDGWWVAENITVFAFVSQNFDGKKDVLQASKTKIYQP